MGRQLIVEEAKALPESRESAAKVGQKKESAMGIGGLAKQL